MRVKIADDVMVRDMAGEAVLLHLGTGSYFGLDSVGVRIWRLLEAHQSTEAVVALMLQEFEVDERRLRMDLEALVAQLLGQGLLRVTDTAD